MSFLKAEWRDLALVSYSVDPARVASMLPDGLVPDCYEGRTYVSLVGLHFRKTRVLGVPWPGHTSFPEVNLRLYVRHPASGTRGVWFVRELVPKRLVAWIARRFYDEPYATTPMRAARRASDDAVAVTYRFPWRGAEQVLRVSGMRPAEMPPDETLAHFLKERRHGYGKTEAGDLRRYTVEHPPWWVHPVDAWHLTLDWEDVYGPDWAFLQDAEPASVLLAAGSPVTVSWHETLSAHDVPAPDTAAIPFPRRPFSS